MARGYRGYQRVQSGSGIGSGLINILGRLFRSGVPYVPAVARAARPVVRAGLRAVRPALKKAALKVANDVLLKGLNVKKSVKRHSGGAVKKVIGKSVMKAMSNLHIRRNNRKQDRIPLLGKKAKKAKPRRRQNFYFGPANVNSSTESL